MYAPPEESINNCNSDSDSNYEDEDELTRIIPPEVEDTKYCLKSRYILGIMGFLGFANVYAMRVNLSVAIVAMVNNTALPQPSTNSSPPLLNTVP
ncbi:hypothetical protein NQ317_008657 [Molorchus minor]|uniref:Uncharacterized protein n=1 Tax=Molorchus minor TaxID=1323400 RepID=A0ABQ9K0Y5_9CUCU|nr:hypothetical protein NQ317_008657 [Molorchus minor]